MNIKEINDVIQSAIDRLLSLEGNTEVRDNLLRAKGSLELLQIYIKGGDVKSVLDIVSRLAEADQMDEE